MSESLIEEDPVRAIRNATERIREMTKTSIESMSWRDTVVDRMRSVVQDLAIIDEALDVLERRSQS